MSEKWYRLDNAALAYVPSANSKWSCVFRLACVLKDPVDKVVLQQAAEDILPRFPTFNVRLRAGFFWYYFDENKSKYTVEEETDFPCQYMNVRNSKHLFRIFYFGNRIAVEVFHGISDGGGGLIFLKTLVRRYLELKGAVISGYSGCLNYLDKPSEEELEDAYVQVADMKAFRKRSSPVAYKPIMPFVPKGRYYLLHGEMDTSKLKDAAKKKNCSLGEILASAILYSCYLHKKRHLQTTPKKNRIRPVVLCTSIDLRRRFPCHDSLRNFSLYHNIVLHEDEYTFDDVLATVKENFKLITDKDFMMEAINTNVRESKRAIVKYLPLTLKNIGLDIGYKLFGENLNSCSMSNYGLCAAPDGFERYVERFESSIGVAKIGRNIDTSVISFAGKTVITFCSMGVETEIERDCFNIFTSLGVDVKVDGNRRVFNE